MVWFIAPFLAPQQSDEIEITSLWKSNCQEVSTRTVISNTICQGNDKQRTESLINYFVLLMTNF